jgi:SAM-dependent methyltransferase
VSASQRPLPPAHLVSRVGYPCVTDETFAEYEEDGRRTRDDIVALLPDGWSFDGKRVLDFGCGSGRVLRHFLDEADRADEFAGCDIDGESVEWIEQWLSPPMRGFRSEAVPPLPVEAGTYDLVYACSIFTHLAESWSVWLLEMARILRPDGILLASFLGRALSEMVADEEWDEDRVGMNVLRRWQGWELGGPLVLHSPWWIREHWGRLFDVEELWESGFAKPWDRSLGHGVVRLRRTSRTPSVEELEALRPDEPREIEALRHNIQQLHRESDVWRTAVTEHERAARKFQVVIDELRVALDATLGDRGEA